MRWRFVTLGALLVSLVAFWPVATAGGAGPLSLDVNFDYAGNITVTLPNGTAVGTTSGTPTVIPAGYYIVTLTQPGCVDVPTFILQGPGVNIEDDLQSGEEVSNGDAANFQPNSTYTWRSGSVNPPVNYTFVTNGNVVGEAPGPSAPATVTTGSNKAESNTDVLGAGGSTKTALRGVLAGAVSAGGVPSLHFQGKPVTRLSAGRYTLTLSDASKSAGFMLGTASRVSVTKASFAGKRSLTVDLTSGKWYVESRPAGPRSYFTVGR